MKRTEWANSLRWKADYRLPGAGGGRVSGGSWDQLYFWAHERVLELTRGGG